MARLGIRPKLSAALILAAAAPLAIGLISIRKLGRESYQRDKGQLFATISRHLASNLGADLDSQVDHLRGEARLTGLGELLAASPAPAEPVADIEARWPALDESDPLIRDLLNNQVAANLRGFQQLHPRFAELIATDAAGRLAGATNKSSDYDQADEPWWRRAIANGPHQAWLEGIQFDQSARVYSVDIALPVYTDGDNAQVAGTIKGILDISPLFASVAGVLNGGHPLCDVVLDDGRILVRLYDQTLPPLEHRVPEGVIERIRSRGAGWQVVSEPDRDELLVGYCPIRTEGGTLPGATEAGLTPMYVVVYDTLDRVMAPVIRQLRYLTLAGLGLVLAFLCTGIYVADRKIVGPIQTLRRAAQTIAAQARLEGAHKQNGTPAAPAPDPQLAAGIFDRISEIRSDDEIGDLAHDFRLMAKRVLRYHEQLETELAVKTEEIERDLMVAREFQEALLPSVYPTVPGPPDLRRDPIALGFYHVYKPATSVGGDFFHMVQISDHEAGVFIADVMGHGARSALITAILRTLLENLARETTDPTELLGRINHQFWSLLPQKADVIFATAFYGVFNTASSEVRYASAGHPPPLLIRHPTNVVEAILDITQTGPALGLFKDSTYALSRRPLQPGDVVLLYTDGVIEAPNVDGEDFGIERLRRVIQAHAGEGGEALGTAVVEALHQFMDVVVSPDDICLVSIDVRGRGSADG